MGGERVAATKKKKEDKPLKKSHICFKCISNQPESKYYESKSAIYEGAKRLPICKDCVNDLFLKYLFDYGEAKFALYELCRKLDMPFRKEVYNGALKKDGIEISKHYFRVVNSFREKNQYGNCFDDGETTIEYEGRDGEVLQLDKNKVDLETQIFWGFGFESKDYIFLEIEISKWKQTHKCDNQAELTLLKEICMKILEIRNSREKGNNVSKEQKELQDLMKTASVDPAKSNAISSGQNVDRFGVWIKDIEQNKPAEWWNDQEKYKDMDGFQNYINDYIVRPIRNFFTGTKDFIVNGEDLSFKEDEGDSSAN